MKLLVEDPIAAADTILVDPGSDEIERAALPRIANSCRRVLGVESAHAHSEAGWREDELVADPERTGKCRAGDDRADAGQCKAAVDREAKAATPLAWRQVTSGFQEPRFALPSPPTNWPSGGSPGRRSW
jgi:hypothetical protein